MSQSQSGWPTAVRPRRTLSNKHAATPSVVLHAPARALLQDNQAPQVGGFQAARYFTYVFFALAISVVLVMIFLCTMHCYRRARRQQEVELHAARGPVSLPEVNIQIEPQQEQAAPPPKPLNVYDAVLVRHPDGSKEVAYAPAIVARVLQPELTAAQKAVLRRSMRINSVSRYEAGDARARRRRQVLEASLGRSHSGGLGAHPGPADPSLPISTGDLLRGWSMEGAELLYASHRTASASSASAGAGREGAARGSPDHSPSRAPHRRRGSARHGSSGRRHSQGQPWQQQEQRDSGGHGSMTVQQLEALQSGDLIPFYTSRGRSSSRLDGAPPVSGPGAARPGRHAPQGGHGGAGLQLSSSGGGDSDSSDEWRARDTRQRPQCAGRLSTRLHRHVRRHHSNIAPGSRSSQQ